MKTTVGTFFIIGGIVLCLLYFVSTTEENRQFRGLAKETACTIEKNIRDYFGSK